MGNPPTGTITFMFTDVEGSTRRWEHKREAMKIALALHDALLRVAIETNGGYVFGTAGDAFCAAFSTATDALNAALSAQRACQTEDWDSIFRIPHSTFRIRAALHTGSAEERDGDYFGPPLNRVARLLATGHGGQTLLSEVTQGLVRDLLPPDVDLLDLGEHRLKDLILPEHVFQIIASDLPSDFPPLKTLDSHPNNLPLQPTPLVGREKDVATAQKLLLREEVRLVTLTGPGGTGKTRLGLQVAADVIDEFSDGVFFVPLADITDHQLVASTIARTLGVREGVGLPLLESLKNYFHGRQTLLLLDNFEQVAPAASLVSELLAAAPGLKVLITSREILHLRGEKEFIVPPLALPDLQSLSLAGADLALALVQYGAVALFVQRAVDAKSDFEVTNDNALAVAEICHRLDGLPLAIELAATRIKLLTPQAMLAKLVSHVPSGAEGRLKLLTGGPRDLPARQQTLRDTIAWSYDLLNDGERQLFERLSAFVGGCTLEAAEAVASASPGVGGWGLGVSDSSSPTPNLQPPTPTEIDVLDGVTSLVDKSLLRAAEGSRRGAAGDETRFWMLETIREYGLERLAESGEAEDIRRHHKDFFLGLAEQAEPQLQGPEQADWLERLEVEHGNLRSALGWTIKRGEAETALRLCGALWRFWFTHGYLSEGRRWLQAALSNGKSGGPGALRGAAESKESGETFAHSSQLAIRNSIMAKALYAAGMLAYSQDDYASAHTFYEQSLAVFRDLGDIRGIAESLNGLGLMACGQSDYALARKLHEESLATFRELKDGRGIASTLFFLANTAMDAGDLESERTFREQSLEMFRGLGNKIGIATSLNGLGEVARRQDDYEAALSLYEESLAIYREVGHKKGIATTLHNLGYVVHRRGDYARAMVLFLESLALYRELGNKQGIAECLVGLAGVTGAQAQPKRAITLFGAAEALLQAIGTHLDHIDRAEYDHAISTARDQLGEAAFEKAWAEGRVMVLSERGMELAIAYALEGFVQN